MCYWDYSSHISIYAWTGRGYTGYEMHDAFGLINMNARMYDPILGRMCAPDNLLHPQYGTQGFNRYSYVVNNPLKYTDPDGEWIHIVIGAVVGGVINLGAKLLQDQIHSFGDGLAAFGIGAVAGAVGTATGGAAFLAAGGAASGTGGFLAGAAGGAMGNAFSMPILSAGNAAYFKDAFMTPEEWAIGVGIGAVTGGLTNGTIAAFNDKDFLRGNLKVSSLGFSNMESIPVSGYKTFDVDKSQGIALGKNPQQTTIEFGTVKGIDYKQVYGRLIRHGFSYKHVRDGVLTIGNGSRIGTMDVAVKVIELNRNLLVNGSN